MSNARTSQPAHWEAAARSASPRWATRPPVWLYDELSAEVNSMDQLSTRIRVVSGRTRSNFMASSAPFGLKRRVQRLERRAFDDKAYLIGFLGVDEGAVRETHRAEELRVRGDANQCVTSSTS